MSPIHHRVPVVIGLTLALVVTTGAAAAATRTPDPQPPESGVATTPITSAINVVRQLAPSSAHRHARPRSRTATHPLRPARHSTATRSTLPRHRTSRPHPRHRDVMTGPTGWAALDAAIARIPSYRPGGAMWIVSDKYGHWGTADWYRDMLYIAPGVPASYLYDVAVHEWSHELTVLDYAGDVDAAVRAMDATFGGSGLVGAERAADCMAILQGATWTHYTRCSDSGWRRAAAKLVAGQRL